MIRHVLLTFAAGAMLLTSTAAHGSYVEISPPSKIKLDVKSVRGSGCHKDDATVRMNADNSAFTVTYRKFIVHVGPNSTFKDASKACHLIVGVQGGDGYRFAIRRSDFRGYANLGKDVSGNLVSMFYIRGSSEVFRINERFAGPFNDSWKVHRDTDQGALEWSACNSSDKDINLKHDLYLEGGYQAPATSLMTLDSTDHSAESEFQLAWRRC